MLCSSKTNHRPDQALRRKLVCLSYSLLALAAAVILFMVYPEYFTVLILVMLFLISLCLILTIQTIYSGEEAMRLRRLCQRDSAQRIYRSAH